jgi:DNA-binding NtrC family response regulator
MPHSSSTLDIGSTNAVVQEQRAEVPALLIAWAPAEPDRTGAVALFEPDAGARILGRSEPAGGASGERVVFHRQRPGVTERMPPLASAGISREQLRIRLENGGLRVLRIGKCAMEVRGTIVDSCILKPGDTLLLRGQLLLFCTRRPWKMEPLRSASLADAPPFGAPDSFGIVGESPAVWRLRDRIAWTATADEHTLLLGGSGSGKELCARAVHALSSRAKGPFVARNAATIPSSLIDAELFGNVKGYPNPGMPERPGLVGAADHGTLFLDEIGELSQELQANLLRVLDEGGEYHSLGASAARRSHFRLIGATNRDPSALKHDLAARLVVRLDVPGLDDRRDDIPLLARHLLARATEKSPEATRRFLPSAGGRPELRVKASLLDHLLAQRYTTNIRELNALLWHAMSASTGDAIEWHRGAPPEQPAPAPTPRDGAADSVPEVETPEVPEPTAEEVRASLAENHGNILRTARALGLSSRYVLYRLMKRYGIGAEEGS